MRVSCDNSNQTRVLFELGSQKYVRLISLQQNIFAIYRINTKVEGLNKNQAKFTIRQARITSSPYNKIWLSISLCFIRPYGAFFLCHADKLPNASRGVKTPKLTIFQPIITLF